MEVKMSIKGKIRIICGLLVMGVNSLAYIYILLNDATKANIPLATFFSVASIAICVGVFVATSVNNEKD
jgi:hypothetical protein